MVEQRKLGLRRGIPILPSLFTTANIFCGYFAVILAMRRNFTLAVVCIFVAGLADILDGRIARMTGMSSEFGKELDSLADIISFGVAPAILVYTWAFSFQKPLQLQRLGAAAGFLFVICGAIRLARFNVQIAHTDKRYFVGLPIPAAAGAAASIVLVSPQRVTDLRMCVLLSLTVLLLGLLMISKLRYRSFKDVDLRSRKSVLMVFFFALFFAAMILQPRYTLLLSAASYAMSGPASRLYHALTRKTHPAELRERQLRDEAEAGH
ncbi:MAG: CDP-diacylglycerol--serine O-phosphatidyltransferase [Acidobacteriota bacterium]